MSQSSDRPRGMPRQMYNTMTHQTRTYASLFDTTGIRQPSTYSSWADQVEEEMQTLGIDPNQDYEVQVENEEEELERPASSARDDESVSSDEDDKHIFELDIDTDEQCCACPRDLNIQNVDTIIDYFSQFIDTKPDYGCLQQGFQVANSYLSILNSATQVHPRVGDAVKAILKHRHDYFAYVFLNEVIGLETNYGTDVQLAVGTGRTPDFIHITGDHLEIYEFSVVGNLLRGNFLKGIDNATSKYANEIKLYEQQGKTVQYKPITFSTSSTLEENIEHLTTRGYNINDFASNLLNFILINHKPDYAYLFSWSFLGVNQQNVTHDFNDKYWCFKEVHANRPAFHNLIRTLRKYDFDESKFYNVNSMRNGEFRIRESDFNNNGNTGHKMIQMIQSEEEIYDNYQDIIKGKERFKIISHKLITESSVNIKPHGKTMETTISQGDLILNTNRFCMYSSDKFEQSVKKLWDIKWGNLADPVSLSEIESGIQYLKNESDKFMIENYVANPPIVNNPRRSFVNMIDTMHVNEILYDKGVDISFSPYDCRQQSTKMILSRLDQVKYFRNEIEDPTLLPIYKTALSKISAFLSSKIDDYSIKGKSMSFKTAMTRLNSDDRLQFINLKNELKKTQNEYKYKVKNNSGLLRINKDERQMIKNDMNWHSKRGYLCYMDEMMTFEDSFNVFNSFSKPINFKFQIPVQRDLPFFANLKQPVQKMLKEHLEEVNKLSSFNWAVFHARLCYTLFAASNRSFNSDYVCLDNLGLSNVVVIIKGGRKITTTRSSKVFKLIYPCRQEAVYWQNKKNIFISNNIAYEETGWMTMPQQHIVDGMSLHYKYLMNYHYLRTMHTKHETQNIIYTPVALALHNRRKTETMMHNMRYLIVNTLGVASKIGKMVKEFAGPCYTAFDHSLRYGLINNYLNYVKTSRNWMEVGSNDKEGFNSNKVFHPYLNRYIYSMNDLSYVIYATFMMSKGGYQQTLEQTNNLSSLIETHNYYLEKSDANQPVEVFSSADELDRSDFVYSKVNAYAVGRMLSCELKKKRAVNNLNIQYQRLKATNIDVMANNKGLRYKGKEFFSNKGYYVIYKELMSKNFPAVLEVINDTNTTLAQKRKSLSLLNETFKSEQMNTPLEECVFHVVDKTQRGGSREIYVMDYNTKLYQYPIEKMFKFICEFVDNEIISVPSSKRANLIHRKNFEYKDEKYNTYFLSFDCRKWAPRSSTSKYIDMIKGMVDVLPSEFVQDVLHYFEIHSNKKVYTRTEILQNYQKQYRTEANDIFTIDKENPGAAYFRMPYSFVMGIFNMLSSLFHAGAQLLIKYCVERDLMLNEKQYVAFNMFAHSDDSAGNVITKADSQSLVNMRTTIQFYEKFQKSVNHLMSDKKCNISLVYFELLSILYLNFELIPVIPKFMSNLNMSFSGEGLSSDMKQVVSKSIELLSNGATGAHCYALQLCMSNLYRNFYRVETDTTIPALGGTADSWPELYMAYGSAIDEIRVAYVDNDFYSKYITFAVNNLDFDIQDGTINLKYRKIMRIPQAYTKLQSLYKLPEFEDSEWFFQQNKTGHALLNIYWFLANLKSYNFAKAILNINEIRRAYDSLYMASGHNILGKTNIYNINNLNKLILLTHPTVTNYQKYLNVFYKGAFDFLESVDHCSKLMFNPRTQFGYKPSSFSMVAFTDIPIHKFKSLDLAVNIARPELLPYLYTDKVYGYELEAMRKLLQSLNIPLDMKFIKNFLDHITKNRSFVSNFYMDTKRSARIFSNNEGLFDLICKNYSQTQVVNVGGFYTKHHSLNTAGFSNQIKEIVNAHYLYAIYKESRLDSLSQLPIKINGKTYQLNSLDNITSEFFINNSSYFMTLIGKENEVNINLDNIDCWAVWIERQAKVGDSWVGTGKLLTKIDQNYMILNVRNTLVENVNMINSQEFILSETGRCFLEELLKANKLSLFSIPNLETYDLFLAYNNQDILGVHNPSQVRIGVPVIIDNWLDVSSFGKLNKHSFFEGKHIIRVAGVNYNLQTIDSLVYNSGRSDVFKYIDWDVLNDQDRNTFLSVVFTGKYGNIETVDFDFDDLRANILKTEAYKLVYNKVIIGKNSLHNVFWNDMMSNLTITEDILPLIYENTGSGNISKLLPESKKDLVAMSKYYSQNNDALFDLNKKLKSATTESARAEIFTRMLTELNDVEGISLLPELGDEAKFDNWSNTGIADSKVQIHHWFDCALAISEAYARGFEQLQENKKIKYVNTLRNDMSAQNIFMILVGDQSTEYRVNCNNYIAVTFETMQLHKIITEIFNNSSSFIEFARSCRRTVLTTLPRHPRYLEEWQWLTANIIKFFRKNIINDEDKEHLPAFYKRKMALTKLQNDETIQDNLEIVNPLARLMYHIDEKDEDAEWETYDLIMNSQKEFNLNYKDHDRLIIGIEDLYDDNDLEFDRVRQNTQNTQLTCLYKDKPVILPNTAVLCPWFFPIRNIRQKYVNNKKYYVYNYNDDKQKELKTQPVNKTDIVDYRQTISYYMNTPDFSLTLTNDETIKFKDIEIDTTDFTKLFDINNPESYTEELLNDLIDQFKLDSNEQVVQDLKKAIFANRTPTMKALMIKRIVNNFQKEHQLSIDKLLTGLFQEYRLSVDLSEKTDFMSQLNYIKGNTSSLVYSSTTLKKEYKQFDVLLKNKFADVISNQTVLSSGNKKHLISNIKLLIQQLKYKQRKNNVGFLRILLSIIEGCAEGHTNQLGRDFDELIREYITECTEPISDEEDISEVDEPEFTIDKWKISVG